MVTNLIVPSPSQEIYGAKLFGRTQVDGAWSVLLQLSGSHSSYAGYSSLQQLSSGEVLCLWEGACTTASFLQANVMCLASVDVGVNEEN